MNRCIILPLLLDKRISVKTPLSVSQASLEGIHLVIKSLKNRISKDTGIYKILLFIRRYLIFLRFFIDASKQRIELKKQMGKYVEKAKNLLVVINPQLDGYEVTLEDCYRGVFPWQSAYDSETHNLLYNVKKLTSCFFSIVPRKIQFNRCLDAFYPK